MKKTVYRKCPCGETAHDYDGHASNGRPSYKCRNCGAVRVPAKRSGRAESNSKCAAGQVP